MISKEGFLSTHELAQFSHKHLVDDRQDYIIEVLNNIIASDVSSLEDKVLAFEKLGDLYWNYTGDLDKALEYINSAIEFADTEDIGFRYLLRGCLLEKKLQLLSLLERNDEIEKELDRIINKYINKEFKSNSYLYNAYKYKAAMEYKECSFKAALEYLVDAQRYYPAKFYANRLHVIETSDYKNEYENLESLLSRYVYSPGDWQI